MNSSWKIGFGIGNTINGKGQMVILFGTNRVHIKLPFKTNFYEDFSMDWKTEHQQNMHNLHSWWFGKWDWGGRYKFRFQYKKPNSGGMIHYLWEKVVSKSTVWTEKGWVTYSLNRLPQDIVIYHLEIDNKRMSYVRKRLNYKIKILKLLPFFSYREFIIPIEGKGENITGFDVYIIKPGMITMEKKERFNRDEVDKIYTDNKGELHYYLK